MNTSTDTHYQILNFPRLSMHTHTCCSEGLMLPSLLLRDSLNVIDPPMAIRVLRHTHRESESGALICMVCIKLSQLCHFFVGAAELGEVVDAFDADERAIHVEADCVRLPPHCARCCLLACCQPFSIPASKRSLDRSKIS